MGEDEKNDYTVYLNGEPISPVITDLKFTTIEDSETTPPITKTPNGSITFAVKYKHKNMYRMSRKRYIKLLMARGACRNIANELANLARVQGQPYKSKWFDIIFLPLCPCRFCVQERQHIQQQQGGTGNEATLCAVCHA